MKIFKKKSLTILVLNLVIAASVFLFVKFIPFNERINWKIYDTIAKFAKNSTPLPAKAKDILLVPIGNPTLKNIPFAWPYPRSVFARIIDNLAAAQAKVIAFDFIFLGESKENEDAALRVSLERNKNVVLAQTISEEGTLGLSTRTDLAKNTASGVITKLQDSDGVVRKNLTFLVDEDHSNSGYLSWEMRILEFAENIKLSTLNLKGSTVSFRNEKFEKWSVPIWKDTGSFLIRFCANTADFNRISFYQIYEGNFDRSLVKDKIVMIGFLSSLLADIHNTPLGFLPGITLNANAFLSLYAKNFLREIPRLIQLLILFILVSLLALSSVLFKKRAAIFIVSLELVLFFVFSYWLYLLGYIWNYFIVPFSLVVCFLINRKLPQKYLD
ncbi:MAG: CHASE2 domain-containing protein [Candidatus Omnitrophica bacterium]|nr:CHASE2 domain-containing protein [Candidatus Omnitrophota bacterium]